MGTNKYIEIVVIVKNFLYICISSLEDRYL
jgi:hypothetical protein